MEQKTKIDAPEGSQQLFITREFDLPLHLLFKAYEEPAIVEQWMGTKVIKQENRPHGSWRYETKDPRGNLHCFNGTFHEFQSNHKITRTFEMENAGIGVQLEFLEFQEISATRSKLVMQIIYRSVEARQLQLSMPFAFGINMAHDRLEQVLKNQS